MVHSITINQEMTSKHSNLIICGTDTDIGKTFISALFVQGLKAFYWKPIQSGTSEGSDTSYIQQLLNIKRNRCLPEAYKFKAPVSPHWAAEKEGQSINLANLKVPNPSGPLIIETAGGLMVPLNRKILQIDQLKIWGFPVLLVAKSGLGTLNHTLLSIEALKKRNIPIKGIVLNGETHEDNPKTLMEFCNVPVLAQIPKLKEINAAILAQQWEQQSLDQAFSDFH